MLSTRTTTEPLAAAQERSGPLALEELYRQYRGPVQRYLYQLCGSAELSEVLTQETFIKALTGLLSFRGECSVATWLFRIARNVYINSLRRPDPQRVDTDEFLDIPDCATTPPASSAI